ncbi:Secreted lipase [Sphaceloma murrayae]|uniref:Carboxylic ester hydrolase n=1 Tax=Sphaceloma murrayae TaxID=2082308 RepID=A0A2K1QW74_9PEZI|nr:Secreted lipase [Sphaceloma murrayae]
MELQTYKYNATTVLAADPLVDIGYARYQGFTDGDVTKWYGVRFAAPPTGNNRFRAPQDPEPIAGIVNATKQGPICPPQQSGDWTLVGGSTRYTVDEDCLFLSVTAPSGAGARLRPVLFWIQGGGFGSNSNANYDAKTLVGEGDIVVVQINYRVGMYGFLQSENVRENGDLNAGIHDMIKALQWVKTNIEKFGGDPNRVVIDGISAGGSAAALLLAANGGTLDLFHGAIVESGGWVTMRPMDQGEEQYECLVKEKGCDTTADSLACLRALNQSEVRSSNCWFNPHIDGELFTGSLLDMFTSGKVATVPTIMGACANEGTKYSAPEDTNSSETAAAYFKNTDPSLSPASLDILDDLYINQPGLVYPGKGSKFRQAANAIADVGTHCILRTLQSSLSRLGAPTWTYRFALRDPADETAGYGAWHGVNMYATWGAMNTDQNPPASYQGIDAPNRPGMELTRAYWTAFVRELEPNGEGRAVWDKWDEETRGRLRIENQGGVMERMSEAQSWRCEAIRGMSESLGEPKGEGVVTELDAGAAKRALEAEDCGFDEGCRRVGRQVRRRGS